MKFFAVIAALPFLLPVLVYAQDSINVNPPVPDTIIVKKVASGTTFTTDDGQTITLLGLSTPKSQAVTATGAKDYLASLIDGKTLTLVVDSLAPVDTKKTKLRYVYNGPTLVNLEMLEDGYATVSATEHSLADSFKEANNQAKSAHLGAYATEGSTAVQCSATTKKGTQCRRMTTDLSGKCWQHQ